ncbi:hypothetical protein D3C87_1594320 [compost metagenome]
MRLAGLADRIVADSARIQQDRAERLHLRPQGDRHRRREESGQERDFFLLDHASRGSERRSRGSRMRMDHEFNFAPENAPLGIEVVDGKFGCIQEVRLHECE